MYKTLLTIQQKMKSRKDCYNDFGGFSYRNVEKMLTDLKPILREEECCITFNDEVIELGGRWYVKATATLHTAQGDITASAYAREQESKKGMDQSQITGSCSTYARKYALCGLLAIDDGSADPDRMDNREASKPITKAQIKNIEGMIEKTGTDTDKFCQYFGISAYSEMTAQQYGQALNMLNEKANANE